jgi:hypothetical protein
MTAAGVPGDDPDDGDRLNDPKAVEAAFDEIVANLGGAPGVEPPAPWPEAERPGPEPAPVDRSRRTDWSEWDDLRPADISSGDGDDSDVDSDEDEDEHYVPPPPPPVPRGDRKVRWAWAGAVGTPVVAIVLPLLGVSVDGVIGLLLVGAFLAGFVTLISRLRPGPRVDDGPDDGAVV